METSRHHCFVTSQSASESSEDFLFSGYCFTCEMFMVKWVRLCLQDAITEIDRQKKKLRVFISYLWFKEVHPGCNSPD